MSKQIKNLLVVLPPKKYYKTEFHRNPVSVDVDNYPFALRKSEQEQRAEQICCECGQQIMFNMNYLKYYNLSIDTTLYLCSRKCEGKK